MLPYFLFLSFGRLFRSGLKKALITRKKVRRHWVIVHPVTQTLKKGFGYQVYLLFSLLLQSLLSLLSVFAWLVVCQPVFRRDPSCLLLHYIFQWQTSQEHGRKESRGSPPMTIKMSALSRLAFEPDRRVRRQRQIIFLKTVKNLHSILLLLWCGLWLMMALMQIVQKQSFHIVLCLSFIL